MANDNIDIHLIERILHHDDTKAFEQLLMRHRSAVWNTALAITHDTDLAAEVLQETFIKLWKRLDTWRGENIKAWITIIANHTAIDILEKEKRRNQEPLNNYDSIEEINDQPEKEQQLQQLEKAIQTLSEQDQQIINLYYLQKIPIKQIAQLLQQTPNNIAVKLHHIRERLKKRILYEPHQ